MPQVAVPPRLRMDRGMTEACSQVTTATSMELRNRPHTVGSPLDGLRVKIIDENLNELEPLKIGRIWVSGGSIIKNYYGLESDDFVTRECNCRLGKNQQGCGYNNICRESTLIYEVQCKTTQASPTLVTPNNTSKIECNNTKMMFKS